MGTVVLVRHARTTANTAGILAGWSPDVHLDETGARQAAALGARWTSERPVTVVSSPLPRCVETARSIVPVDDITLDERLGECHYGAWTGRPLAELAKDPLWRTVQDDPENAVFPAHPEFRSESLPQMRDRAVSAIADIDAALTQRHGGAHVWVAVSHGDVIKAILAECLGSGLPGFQRIVVDPASVSIVHWGERPMVLRTNDTSSQPMAETGAERFTAAPGAPSADESSAPAESDGVVGGGAGAP